MKKFWSIFTFTYKETIRNKALIISTIITLIVMLGFFNMDKIVGLFNREGSKDLIMVSTEANNKFFDSNTLESLNDDDFKVVLSKDSEETNKVKKEIENGKSDYKALLEVSTGKEVSGKLYVNELPGDSLMKKVNTILNDTKFVFSMEKFNITPEEYANIMTPAQLDVVQTGNASHERMALVYALVFGIYIITLTFGSMVANSVIEEKSNRIMETLITMAKPMELFFGKVLGICAVGLTQIAVILGSGLIMLKTSGTSLEVLSSLNLNASIIFAFVAYFLLGYLTFSMLYAAVASLATSSQDVNSSMGAITLVFVGVFLLAMNCMFNIESTLAKVFSYIPFASPLIMFERIVLSKVTFMEILITTIINVGFIILVGFFSSKLYKKGTLHYGKKASLIKIIRGKE
ncbi:MULTISPECIES: ABC transporter permease [Clostridium]|uniref:Lipoprotein n=1 Tax=Clostridium perfringens (strain ATCC 13124 / DSM 756 / JCM 1290 / NCIMB 6125 / NCTC 8237 / Type A) TaxID=195103 RepID=A0A0H2YT89_CLOP1|nr:MULTISPECIES: ABC transporter permease [Clostridium]ABG84264.1 putative lipoprotein [Clostridium perfringens ATCC 13124]EGT0683661.1 ABC transporter permease [Clostridium perfringens]EGT0686265.1 ABC transporter permease [Clostridium perfringens]EGT0689251.1 ABC transporter permease [Clostridium perfringens]EGT4141399.1 ABC transporter permease [Clostridium perfringens]